VGIGVLVFQVFLGKDLHWSLPGLSFILLVAVGADYNMLLISRIRDESPHGVRYGVIRTVGTTGGVITSAGLIFAASMFGLLFASISTMAEAGFIIGVGILIDTFLVRTITVPAIAAMIGQKNWWPSQLGKSPAQVYAAYQSKQRQLEHLSDQLVRLKVIPSVKTQVPVPPKPATKVRTPTNGDAHGERAATRKRKPPTELVRKHALPLFDLSGLSHLDLGRSAPVSPTFTNGNGKRKVGRHPGHSLPLFGQSVLSLQPVTLRANGNGHANGDVNGTVNGHLDDNGNGEQSSVEDDLGQSLPMFGANLLAHQGTKGNGEHPSS